MGTRRSAVEPSSKRDWSPPSGWTLQAGPATRCRNALPRSLAPERLELAQEWVKKYETETKRPFVKSAAQLFHDWLNAQVKQRRLTKADAEMVSMEASDTTAYTEARANVRSFLADLQAGATDLATKALVGYAHSLKPKSEGGAGQYGDPLRSPK